MKQSPEHSQNKLKKRNRFLFHTKRAYQTVFLVLAIVGLFCIMMQILDLPSTPNLRLATMLLSGVICVLMGFIMSIWRKG
jgi:hypothetical protein